MTTREMLEAVAANLWWSWQPDVLELFESLNPEAFRRSRNNPIVALREANPRKLASKAVARKAADAHERLARYLATPGTHADTPRTAYFCMEFGLHESLNLYSGGLGILAGDHCKAASDLGVPFTAIGLFLRDGYFQQTFEPGGWQQEHYPELRAEDHPLALVRDRDGAPVTVTVHLGDTPLHLQGWRMDVGKTRLYLLDSDFDANPDWLRGLTRKLYQGDRDARLRQEIALGIGGLRFLRAISHAPETYHLNEGHCAFVTLELLREQIDAGRSREDAERWVRQHCVFTTHTPVMAGHDRFEPALLLDGMKRYREAFGLAGISERDLLAYGRVRPDDDQEWFTMTVLGLRLARAANGVSRLNGEVARDQWKDLYAQGVQAAPIEHVTNGVHLPTWTHPEVRDFAAKYLGDWETERATPHFWKRIERVPEQALWGLRNVLRRRLVRFAEDRLERQTLQMACGLREDVLTIGFARRFATYKRAPLLFHDVERVIRLFLSADRPLQIIYAGKSHPADDGGKRFLQQIYSMAQLPELQGRVVLLENYDMEVARYLVSGCDVWLNTPRRPMEASGTSGQKINAHGGLNLSILDGWWPEGYDGANGWAIGSDASAEMAQDPAAQDAQDAAFLYETLENSILPEFYTRDAHGLPQGWLKRVRRAMMTLPAAFSAERMVADYAETMYV
jgi:glycogen phosphorylase